MLSIVTRSERSVLFVASVGHALCHVATLVLQQVVVEAARDLNIGAIGWVVALGPFLLGFGAVPAGALGDRFGLRRAYSGYLALLSLSACAAAFASSAGLFISAAALVGLAASIHHPVGLALLTEALPQQRARAFGIHGFVGHLGSTLAPFLVLLLAQFAGWRHTYRLIALVAALLLCVLLATRATLGERAADQQRRAGASGGGGGTAGTVGFVPWRLALAPTLLVVMAAMVANGWVHQGFWSTWTSFVRAQVGALPEAPPTATTLLPLVQRLAELLPDAWLGAVGVAATAVGSARIDAGALVAIAGALATFVCAFGSVGELFGARLAKRGSGLRAYAVMNAISAAGLVGVACGRGPWLLAAGALFTFCHFGTQPIENELIARRADPRIRGVAYGMKFVVSFGLGSMAAGPAIAVWQNHGFPPVFLVLAGLALGGAVTAALLARRRSVPPAR